MDAGLAWSAAGSAAGILGSALIGWQVRLQQAERRERRSAAAGGAAGAEHDGLPVVVPFGLLPGEVRGRDGLLTEIGGRLSRRRRGAGAWVLTGMGGLGKSTTALAVARLARARGWRVWWVSAGDSASLTGGMVEVLRELDAPESVVRLVRAGGPAAAARAWDFLNGGHLAGRRWLLIFDNADVPAVLAAPGAETPADHAGWLRPDPAGMVIITSRVRDRRVWGPGIEVRELRPLDDATGARVLADLPPEIRDQSGEARELSRRLGGLPLALHLAGSYLASPFAGWRSFADYRQALDSADLPAALADLDQQGGQPRAAIGLTWDLSLDGLAAQGRPQARTLLFVLSCYAPAVPIPGFLLRPEPLAGLLARPGPAGDDDPAATGQRLRDGLRGLAAVGLIDIGQGGETTSGAVVVHPVVADVNRVRLGAAAKDDLPRVAGSAVALMRAACDGLDSGRPSDWPAWQALSAHISGLLAWLAARLDDDILADLVMVAARAADALRRAGSAAASEELARSGIDVAGSLGGRHPAVLAARHKMLLAMGEQGKDAEAALLSRNLLSDQRSVFGDDHPDTLAARYGLAWMTEYLGRYAEAENLCRELLADQRRLLGADHPDTLATQATLARLAALQGRYDEADRLSRQSLADRQRLLGPDHPDTLVSRHDLGWMTAVQGRRDEAEALQRDLIKDRERILGPAHPATLVTRRSLAHTITDLGRHAEAEQQLRRLLTDLRHVNGDDLPVTLTARDLLARTIARQGRHAEAEHIYRDLLADWDRTQPEPTPVKLVARHDLGTLLAQEGQYDEAEHLLTHVLHDRQQMLGDEHPATQETRTALADTRSRQSPSWDTEHLRPGTTTASEPSAG